MNNTELLKMYDVHFYKSNGSWPYSARGGGISDFLNDFQYEELINEALDYVNDLLAGGAYDYERDSISSDAYYIRIKNSIVSVYAGYGGGKYGVLQTIPLVDFKLILEEWLKFIS
jgi:hypothetical protein